MVLVNGIANIIKTKTPITPPTKEASNARVSAKPAFPCLANGYPSKVVAIEPTVPGALIFDPVSNH